MLLGLKCYLSKAIGAGLCVFYSWSWQITRVGHLMADDISLKSGNIVRIPEDELKRD
jgi:hypothetical protein